MSDKDRPTAIDLFCGAGGLTLGMKNAGFDVLLGIEVNPKIAKTYITNHGANKTIVKDIRKVNGDYIRTIVGKNKIDMVAGCPPCQGFCSLTSKYKRKDPRNDLVLEMVRIIEEIRPKMVMMENVPGLAARGKPILDEFVLRLESLGYVVSKDILQLADYGIPQMRRRFVLLAGMGFEIPIPKPTHSRLGKNANLRPWITLKEALTSMKDNEPVKFSEAIRKGGPKRFKWHIVADLKEISISRLKALKEGEDRNMLPQELRPKCHVKKSKGFTNVYGRMRWNEISPTMTSGFTTPSMGRFGHPEELRTISVREAALIQTFPKNYIFDTNFMIDACELVGNALPPKFAQIVSRRCIHCLHQSLKD